jgi:hypothetical protein
VNLGSSASGSVTVSNSGNVALAISWITGGGDFSASNNCAGSVAAGGSCTITVTFTPTVGGNRTGTLTVTDNSGNVAGAVQTVGLSGTGVLVPGIQLAPTSINFPNTFPGTQSNYSTVTVTSSGSGTLTITSVGLNGDFVMGTNTCVASLAPGATCTVQVAFAPPTKGTFSANLIFTDNAGNVTGAKQTVALTGTSKCPIEGCE